MDPTITAAIITAIATVIVVPLGVLFTRKKNEVQQGNKTDNSQKTTTISVEQFINASKSLSPLLTRYVIVSFLSQVRGKGIVESKSIDQDELRSILRGHLSILRSDLTVCTKTSLLFFVPEATFEDSNIKVADLIHAAINNESNLHSLVEDFISVVTEAHTFKVELNYGMLIPLINRRIEKWFETGATNPVQSMMNSIDASIFARKYPKLLY